MPKDNIKEKIKVYDFEDLDFGKNFNVILYNGHVEGGYVLHVLTTIFKKSFAEAIEIIEEINASGPEEGPDRSRAVIFTGSEEECNEKVQKVKQLNVLTGNDLLVEAKEE